MKMKNIKNRIKIYAITALIAIVILPVKSADALFQFSVSNENRNLDFGFMKIDEWKELKSEQGNYHNEITCQSDKGDTWYLKIQMLTPFESGENHIPPSSFKWAVEEAIDGNGIIANEGEFNNFTMAPSVAYISGPDDNSGTEVKIRFRYGLQIPKGQVSGNYRVYIRYTLSETL